MVPPRTVVVGALCAAEVVEVGMWGAVVVVDALEGYVPLCEVMLKANDCPL